MRKLHIALLAAFALTASLAPAQDKPTTPQPAPQPESILHAAEVTPLLPASVFFRGQTAPVQTRNSGGVRYSDASLTLFALVDSSGYASTIRDKYQAYLLTEVGLDIEGHRLPPGAYGCGFINNDNFVVMDIGGHDLFTAHARKDSDLRRPTPLQIQPGDEGPYRLYSGRTYITFGRAK